MVGRLLVGDPLHLAGLSLLVTRGRSEHCQVQRLRLVNYHWRTLQFDMCQTYFYSIFCAFSRKEIFLAEYLVLGRCRCLREGGDILGSWGEVRANGEGQRLRVQALRLLLLLKGLLLLLRRQGLRSSCWRRGVGREVEVGREVVDVDVLGWGGHWHPTWQICRQ